MRTGGEAKFLSSAVVVGLDGMGDDEFAGEVGATRVFVEFANGFGDVLDAELLDAGINGHGEFAIEDRRPVLCHRCRCSIPQGRG